MINNNSGTADLVTRPSFILDSGMCLTLRPMRYPQLFDQYKDAIANTWSVDEVSFTDDLNHLHSKLGEGEKQLVRLLVAFFATGDAIVSNNVVITFYRFINSPEARVYLSRQLFEEAQHIEFYLQLLDSYIPDMSERQDAFEAVAKIPTIKAKADFCLKWMAPLASKNELENDEDFAAFLQNIICFAVCVEGLFFFASFAYVFYLRSRGLLPGLAAGTNWVFRDETAHIEFAFHVIDIIRSEKPGLWTKELEDSIRHMVNEAIELEAAFSQEMLGGHVLPGISAVEMKQYLQYVANGRLSRLGMSPTYNVTNPFGFTELQDVTELTNFFERTTTAYSKGSGTADDVAFDAEF